MISKKDLAISLSAHILPFLVPFFLMLMPNCGGKGAAKNNLAEEEGKRNGRSMIDRKILDVPIFVGSSTKTCQNFYYGIGVYESFDGTITHISYGHPAFFSGLKKGDVMINPEEIPHIDHQTFILHVYRKNKRLRFKMTTEKICTE